MGRGGPRLILDASALLAVLLLEPGADRVGQALIAGSAIGTPNLAEVYTRLVELDIPLERANEIIERFAVQLVSFEPEDALQTALLRPPTRARGLSLGDRACLALAMRLGLPAMTADRGWANLDVGVQIEVCR